MGDPRPEGRRPVGISVHAIDAGHRHTVARIARSTPMKIYVHPDQQGHEHTFPTFAKAEWIVQYLQGAPVESARLVTPDRCSRSQVEAVHDIGYVEAIIEGGDLAESNGFTWSPDLWPMVAGSTGAVIAAVREAFRTGRTAGALSSGLHHARADRGMGYCTINGIVVAAVQVIRDGAKRVLILDVDAHCGGGTASMIRMIEGIEQVDVSVHPYDGYVSTPQARLTVVDEIGRDGAGYLAAIEEALAGITEPSTIDVVIVNAGVDPHESAGGVGGITDEVLEARERMIFQWAARHGVPAAWVLAGGYLHGIDREGLVGLHLQTIRAAAEADAARPQADS